MGVAPMGSVSVLLALLNICRDILASFAESRAEQKLNREFAEVASFVEDPAPVSSRSSN
jgi:hypothetical protein